MSTLRTITDFKTALQGGGARPNLFEVDIPTIPAVATQGIDWDADTFQFLCKAAWILPASNVAPIDVPFRGRTLKVAETEPSTPGPLPLSMMKTSNSEVLLNYG